LQNAGLIGVGRMGRAMARHLLAGGFAVTAYDLDKAARKDAAGLGASVAHSAAAAAAAADVVFVAVGFDAEVADVCRRDDGIFAGARPNSVVVVNSTVSVDLVRTLAGEAEAAGLRFLDVPIARGRAAAEEGTLLALAGGDAELLESVRPMLSTFCSDIVHLGGAGHGQVAKAINNLLLWINGVGLMEAGRLADGTGIDLPALRDALLLGSGRSWALENWDSITFTWALKDMQLLLELCDRSDGSFPLTGLVREQVKHVREVRQRGDAPAWTRE